MRLLLLIVEVPINQLTVPGREDFTCVIGWLTEELSHGLFPVSLCSSIGECLVSVLFLLFEIGSRHYLSRVAIDWVYLVCSCSRAGSEIVSVWGKIFCYRDVSRIGLKSIRFGGIHQRLLGRICVRERVRRVVLEWIWQNFQIEVNVWDFFWQI